MMYEEMLFKANNTNRRRTVRIQTSFATFWFPTKAAASAIMKVLQLFHLSEHIRMPGQGECFVKSSYLKTECTRTVHK